MSKNNKRFWPSLKKFTWLFIPNCNQNQVITYTYCIFFLTSAIQNKHAFERFEQDAKWAFIHVFRWNRWHTDVSFNGETKLCAKMKFCQISWYPTILAFLFSQLKDCILVWLFKDFTEKFLQVFLVFVNQWNTLIASSQYYCFYYLPDSQLFGSWFHHVYQG